MRHSFLAKSYYIFMFLMPLLFLSGISDRVLLPRQLFLTVFTGFLLVSIFRSDKEIGAIKLDAAHLAMVLYFLIAFVVSLANASVVSESLYFLSKLWILISFSLLTVWLLKNEVITLDQIVKAAIIFGCAAIFTAVADLADKTIRGQPLFRSVHRISGGFANKNLLSSILYLCLPFFMIGCHANKTRKLVSYAALFLTVVILLILRTRTTLIAAFVFFAITAFFLLGDLLKRKKWFVIAGLFALSAIGWFQFRISDAIGGLESSSDIKQQYFYRLFSTGTFKERVLFWQNSLEMFQEHPFGVGLGNWQIHFPKYGLHKFDSYEMQNGIQTLQRPHNDFLWVLCETGFLGFAAFILIFGFIIYQSVLLIKTAVTPRERWLFIYLLSAVIGFAVIAFFDFPTERIEHQIILMLIFAIIIYHAIKKPGSFSLVVHKVPIRLFVAIGICFSFVFALFRLQSERHIYNLYEARKTGNLKEIVWHAQKAESCFYKIDSQTIPVKWYLGTAYFSQQRFLEAEACFKEAYLLTPYNIHVINNLASCYEVNKKRADAIEMYRNALRISPRFEEARLNLAAVYFNNKDFDKAFNTIDHCSLATRDPKYKMFLPPILKGKAHLVLASINFPVSTQTKNAFVNMSDYSTVYYESKKNNVTFEQQIIRYLKN